jgi:uncharacterized protein (DUF2141 family)
MPCFKTAAFAALVGLSPLAAQAAPLTFTLDGIEARGGKLYIGVQTEAQFMKDGGIAGEIVDAPAAGSQTFTFDVPEGRYSVSAWHDDNGNGVFDRAESGRPIDGWAMINGANLRGEPTFADVSVDVPAGGVSVSETLIYPIK